MRDLNFELKNACKRSNQGSHRTQEDRFNSLQLMANQLYELKFHKMQMKSLKRKHGQALFKLWIKQELNVETIKNRLSHLRWWAQEIGKSSEVYARNRKYFIELGVEYLLDKEPPKLNRSKALTIQHLNEIDNPYTRYSLLLQDAFGLRREESIKFSVAYADKGGFIHLKGSWTKGGRPRDIPVTTIEQRLLLDEIKEFKPIGALIENGLTYAKQLNIYNYQLKIADIKNAHGLRHAYAQKRYYQLTGIQCPLRGGMKQSGMNAEQRKNDQQARKIVSNELGHGRISITSKYIGK